MKSHWWTMRIPSEAFEHIAAPIIRRRRSRNQNINGSRFIITTPIFLTLATTNLEDGIETSSNNIKKSSYHIADRTMPSYKYCWQTTLVNAIFWWRAANYCSNNSKSFYREKVPFGIEWVWKRQKCTFPASPRPQQHISSPSKYILEDLICQ